MSDNPGVSRKFHFSIEEKKKMKELIEKGALPFGCPELNALIFKKYKDDPIGFAQKFLKDHTQSQHTKEQIPSPPFHEEIIDLAYEHNRLALAAPRG